MISRRDHKLKLRSALIRISRQTWAGFVLVWVVLLWGLPEIASASQIDIPNDGPVEVSVSLAAQPNPAVIGQTVDLQVQVNAIQSALIPTGVVEIQSDDQQNCTILLDPQGEGSCGLSFSTPGRVILRAQYLGDTAFLPGSSDKLLLPVVLPGDLPVYQHDFETPVGTEWTSPQREIAPNGEYFLGQFNNETISLHLEQLPAHHWVQVNFDLYIIRSWDGNQIENLDFRQPNIFESPDENLGPDQWSFHADNHSHLNTTFTNWPNFRQAFPLAFDAGDFPAQTGAQDINHLGYVFGENPMDATYHLRYRFIHEAESLTLDFSAMGLQEIADESWALDNLSIMLNTAPAYQIFLPLISQ